MSHEQNPQATHEDIAEPEAISGTPLTAEPAADVDTTPQRSMYMYPRQSKAMMWFDYLVGAALVIGGIYVAFRQFGQLIAGGGVWDIVAGVIGLALVALGGFLIWEGYKARPVDL